MTDTPLEPPDRLGPEGPVHEDDPPTEPDGGPVKDPTPNYPIETPPEPDDEANEDGYGGAPDEDGGAPDPGANPPLPAG